MLACAVLLGGCAGPAVPRPGLPRFERGAPAMGTVFRIVAYAPDREAFDRACDAAFARIDGLEAVMSDYDRGSELSRLAASAGGAPVPASAELAALLARAVEIAARTDGAFDPTVGPVVALWRRARRQAELPAPARLAAARAAVGWEQLRVDPLAGTVQLAVSGMRLDLGGIAKGHAAEAGLAVLRAHGIDRALVDAGGDLVCGEPPPGADGWVIALPGPGGTAAIEVARCAVATSGDLFQFVEIDGVRYAHIVDPRTGLGLTGRRQATVVAPDGALADALASAACVLEPDRALEVVGSFAGASVLLRSAGQAGAEAVEERASAGFPARRPAGR
jgi:thiamine biosynthesis lipoprotein